MLDFRVCLQPSDSQPSVDIPPIENNPPVKDCALVQERQEAYWYARRFGLSVEESEDCGSDFVLHCLTHSLSFDNAPAQRRAYAHNFACDAFRAKSRYTHAQTLSAVYLLKASDHSAIRSSPETALFQLAFWNLMRPALSSLPQALQTMLLDHYGEGWTAKELAEALGRTEGAVNQALLRARRRLYLLLEKASVSQEDLSHP